MATLKDLRKAYPEYDMIDEDEEDRLESIRLYASQPLVFVYAADMSTVSKQEEREPQRRRELPMVCGIVSI